MINFKYTIKCRKVLIVFALTVFHVTEGRNIAEVHCSQGLNINKITNESVYVPALTNSDVHRYGAIISSNKALGKPSNKMPTSNVHPGSISEKELVKNQSPDVELNKQQNVRNTQTHTRSYRQLHSDNQLQRSNHRKRSHKQHISPERKVKQLNTNDNLHIYSKTIHQPKLSIRKDSSNLEYFEKVKNIPMLRKNNLVNFIEPVDDLGEASFPLGETWMDHIQGNEGQFHNDGSFFQSLQTNVHKDQKLVPEIAYAENEDLQQKENKLSDPKQYNMLFPSKVSVDLAYSSADQFLPQIVVEENKQKLSDVKNNYQDRITKQQHDSDYYLPIAHHNEYEEIESQKALSYPSLDCESLPDSSNYNNVPIYYKNSLYSKYNPENEPVSQKQNVPLNLQFPKNLQPLGWPVMYQQEKLQMNPTSDDTLYKQKYQEIPPTFRFPMQQSKSVPDISVSRETYQNDIPYLSTMDQKERMNFNNFYKQDNRKNLQRPLRRHNMYRDDKTKESPLNSIAFQKRDSKLPQSNKLVGMQGLSKNLEEHKEEKSNRYLNIKPDHNFESLKDTLESKKNLALKHQNLMQLSNNDNFISASKSNELLDSYNKNKYAPNKILPLGFDSNSVRENVKRQDTIAANLLKQKKNIERNIANSKALFKNRPVQKLTEDLENRVKHASAVLPEAVSGKPQKNVRKSRITKKKETQISKRLLKGSKRNVIIDKQTNKPTVNLFKSYFSENDQKNLNLLQKGSELLFNSNLKHQIKAREVPLIHGVPGIELKSVENGKISQKIQRSDPDLKSLPTINNDHNDIDKDTLLKSLIIAPQDDGNGFVDSEDDIETNTHTSFVGISSGCGMGEIPFVTAFVITNFTSGMTEEPLLTFPSTLSPCTQSKPCTKTTTSKACTKHTTCKSTCKLTTCKTTTKASCKDKQIQLVTSPLPFKFFDISQTTESFTTCPSCTGTASTCPECHCSTC